MIITPEQANSLRTRYSLNSQTRLLEDLDELLIDSMIDFRMGLTHEAVDRRKDTQLFRHFTGFQLTGFSFKYDIEGLDEGPHSCLRLKFWGCHGSTRPRYLSIPVIKFLESNLRVLLGPDRAPEIVTADKAALIGCYELRFPVLVHEGHVRTRVRTTFPVPPELKKSTSVKDIDKWGEYRVFNTTVTQLREALITVSWMAKLRPEDMEDVYASETQCQSDQKPEDQGPTHVVREGGLPKTINSITRVLRGA